MITYLIVGAATAVVGLSVYAVCSEYYNLHVVISQTFTFIIAVLFAFFPNRYFVFRAKDWTLPVVLKDLWKFYASRFFISMLFEAGFLELFVEILKFPNMPCKIASTVLVTVANYVSSKWFVF